MAIATVRAAVRGGLLHTETCPAAGAGGRCGCPEGRPDHARHRFAAAPPPGDRRTPAAWAADCAREARRLVAASRQAPPETPLPALAGQTDL